MKIQTPWLTGNPGRKLTRAERHARKAVAELDACLARTIVTAELGRAMLKATAAIEVAGGSRRDVTTLVAGALRAAADDLEEQYETEAVEALRKLM